ncbi:hypothetical protein VNO78_09094 [Psophocarpus tetragonolobus]|uniref:Peptidase metallopeptidase domain-containing protein n=1 Tax=Psophocarpus tetragonolobus TaxID=3891 RepID=A0AAN9SXZ3_PSOTE
MAHLIALAILYFVGSVSAVSFPMHHHGPWGGESPYKFTACCPGQNYKGLSNVKYYFHQLGYISDTLPSTFDDNFDDTLVSAIKTYQMNYNLKVTGKLDHDTLQQLTTPRCGVPDITKTNTTMMRWAEGTTHLTYAFSPEWSLHNTFKSAFARAFSKWALVVNIAFDEATSYETANIKIAFRRRNHGDHYPFDGPLGTWAHAFAPPDGTCHFDGDEYWVASGDVTRSPVARAVDLESVAMHEIGHLLGLPHSWDHTAIMYAYLNPRTRKVDLANDDIQGIRHLYDLYH